MAKTLSKSGIIDGSTIEVSHVTQSIDALTGIDAYDITISGSLTLSGGTQMVGNATTATSSSHAVNADNAITATNISTGTSIDTTSYLLFVEDAESLSNPPKLNTGLTFNNSANALTTTTFIGALSGNATTATSSSHAVNADSAISATSASKVDTDSTFAEELYPLMVEGSSGAQPPKLNVNLIYNNQTNALTATTFIGALTGNASTATSSSHAVNADSAISATSATTSTTAESANKVNTGTSEDEESYPLMAEGESGAQPPKLNTGLKYNNLTNALTTTTFIGALSGNATTATTATSASHAVNADNATTATTSSFALTTNTGSLLNNAAKTSGAENKITFTKGDASTFNVTLPAIPTTFNASTGGTFGDTPDIDGKQEAGWVDITIGGNTYYIPVWENS